MNKGRRFFYNVASSGTDLGDLAPILVRVREECVVIWKRSGWIDKDLRTTTTEGETY